jgi:hypothetical protein
MVTVAMAGNLELQGACCVAWKRMRQSRPRATSRWEPQVQGSFTSSIEAFFWNPTRLSHWMIRPRARSRCHWACSDNVVFLKPWSFRICRIQLKNSLQIPKPHGFRKTTLKYIWRTLSMFSIKKIVMLKDHIFNIKIEVF